jgi:aspartyl/glutamyl-tRNA(Asn/Gln) amidotransferase C subunit
MSVELNPDFSIDELARLSRLSLEAEERAVLEQDIASILEFTKILSGQLLDIYDDLYQSVNVENVFREDEVFNCPISLESLVNTDYIHNRYVKVGRVMK